MKRYLLLLFLVTCPFLLFAQAGALLPGYNSMFYPSVLTAAEGIAMPFLLQQKYMSTPGVTVEGSAIFFNGVGYRVHDKYKNPSTGYYVGSGQYTSYGITDFSKIWPGAIPDVLFDAADSTFNAISDCVGFLTRVLSVTGDGSEQGNAYLNIINTTHAAKTSPFGDRGVVTTAYAFAVAFPTFPATVSAGWEYIAGNVEGSLTNTYNHTKEHTLKTYNGVAKGGFAQALPGDVLAFGYSAASHFNGHVMVMEISPQKLTADSLPYYFPAQTLAEATSLLSTYNIYVVSVFDCSRLKQHFRDSRTNMSGIGHGKLLLFTDNINDIPTGYISDSLQVTHSTIQIDTLGAIVYAISVARFVNASSTPIVTAARLAGDSAQTQPTENIYPGIDITVYPNPAHDKITIRFNSPASSSYSLKMLDMTCRILFNKAGNANEGENTLDLDLDHTVKGIYTLILEKDGMQGTKQIVVE